MSRYIDADALKEKFINSDANGIALAIDKYALKCIDDAPSIDIVRCKECKWAKANGAYQWCGRLDSTARITADDYCSHGERKESE